MIAIQSAKTGERSLLLKKLKKKMSLPETEGMNLDNPVLTAKRREVIQKKEFLRRIYSEWYSLLSSTVPQGSGDVLEIGSGGGFMREFIPELITSDLFSCQGVDMVLNACRPWSFEKNQLKAVLMVDVLHHLPDVQTFFNEADNAVSSNGSIAMIEPWVSPWSRLIYSRLHHEPFVPLSQEWSFPSNGPLSGANIALPWILFSRDRLAFKNKFKNLNIETIYPFMPTSYLLSGGVSMRSLMPGKFYPLVRLIEKWTGLEHKAAMFVFIKLIKA
jgi:SAM-dependent methyltransferase